MKLLFYLLSGPVVAGILFFSCNGKTEAGEDLVVVNLYDDTISTSYTLALPDSKGEGVRITYTFFDMKRADSGNFKMTHVYMRHTGDEDTTIVNGTWKLIPDDSVPYLRVYSGRSLKRFDYLGEGIELVTFNTDSMLADTGVLHFRQKADNDIRNSTVKLTGRVIVSADRSAKFIDMFGDTLPILKISAYPDLLALNDSVPLTPESGKRVDLLGTIQIRMAMDGKSVQRALIVEEVVGPR